jgi:hypothetical protein
LEQPTAPAAGVILSLPVRTTPWPKAEASRAAYIKRETSTLLITLADYSKRASSYRQTPTGRVKLNQSCSSNTPKSKLAQSLYNQARRCSINARSVDEILQDFPCKTLHHVLWCDYMKRSSASQLVAVEKFAVLMWRKR